MCVCVCIFPLPHPNWLAILHEYHGQESVLGTTLLPGLSS